MRIPCALVSLLLSASLFAAEPMNKLTDRVFRLAASQYKAMEKDIPEGMAPKSVDADGKLECKDILWWCSGFYPGSLWYIYEYTGDQRVKSIAEKHTLELASLLGRPTHHDIGFQINSTFGNALRLTGEKEKYQDVLFKAADKLAGRFNPTVGCIRSWDAGKWEYPVIIDNMMNLELLLNVYDMNGDKNLYDVATKHANTTMNQHFRPDYSTYHLVNYDPQTGKVLGRQTHQGKADESMWARGEAWAFYGYTMMYRKTGDELYLKQAEYIASLLLRELPADGIPYWDFSCPGELRDASAAAVMASAFVQLYEVNGDRKLIRQAEKMLRKLSSPEYLAKEGTNAHFILKHSVGNMPAGTEVDVPLSYADYYFLEALILYDRAMSHGKLLITDREFSQIRGQLKDNANPILSRANELILKIADNAELYPVDFSFDASGMRLSPAPGNVLQRLSSNSYAYRVTGEKRYLEEVERTAGLACSLYDWNPFHFLDVASIATGLALAYDWLYDDLKPATRKMIVESVYDKALIPSQDFNKAWFYEKTHNWNQVCNGAMVMVALAFREEFGRQAGNIITNAIRTNQKAIKESYSPNGCYPEGPGYWAYGTAYQAILNTVLQTSLGTDLGLSRKDGFSETANYVLFCHGATGRMFNYSDNSEQEKPEVPLWYFAHRFDKPYLLSTEIRQLLNNDDYGKHVFNILPFVAHFASLLDTSSMSKPKQHSYEGKGLTPIYAYRKDWSGTDTDLYLGIKGGKANTNHGHMDAGSFVFDRDGVRWASDPGSIKYAEVEKLIKSRGGNFWEKAQNSMRWDVYPLNNFWHNTLTVNGEHHEVAGAASLREIIDTDNEHGAVVDFTDVFVGVQAAVRRISVDADGRLVVIDTLTAGDEDIQVRFSWVTYVRLSLCNGGAELESEGKRLHLRSEGADVVYSIREYDEPFSKGERVLDMDWKVSSGETVTVSTILE